MTGEDAETAYCGLTLWLLTSQRMSPRPAWTDDTCRRCTNEVISNLVLLMEIQVRRVVEHHHSLHLVREDLERGVAIMKRFQDQLGVNAWLSQFDSAANTLRKYSWLIDKMSRMPLDSQIINKLINGDGLKNYI